MTTIFITGATGFIGRYFLAHVLRTLKPEDRVYALTRSKTLPPDSRIILLTGTLQEIAKYKNQILECDYFFHIAANAIFGNAADYDHDNFHPTVEILDILKASSKLKNFIFLSSIGAVDRELWDSCNKPLTIESPPHPRSRYGVSKLKSEQSIIQSGIPHTIIRATWVYGPGMRLNSHMNAFITLLFRKPWFARFNFPGRVSLIHVEDLAETLTHCLGNQKIINRIYYAETESYSLGEIFKKIQEGLHRSRLSVLPVSLLRPFIRLVRGFLPMTVVSLFLDFLVARDKQFLPDFNLSTPKSLSQTLAEVIESNAIVSGYWIVTGANSGIGFALAQKLKGQGKKIILIDCDTSNIESWASEHVIIKADLSKDEDLFRLCAILRSYPIRTFIHNAGVGFRGNLAQLSMKEIKNTYQVNLYAPLILTKNILDHLVDCQSHLVFMGSSVAYYPLPGMSVYASSKAGLVSIAEAVCYEFKKTNPVTVFSPSGTFTRFQERAGVRVLEEGKGLLKPEDIADRIINSVDRKKKIVFFFSASSWMMHFLSKLMPRQWVIQLWGRVFERSR